MEQYNWERCCSKGKYYMKGMHGLENWDGVDKGQSLVMKFKKAFKKKVDKICTMAKYEDENSDYEASEIEKSETNKLRREIQELVEHQSEYEEGDMAKFNAYLDAHPKKS